MEDPDVRDQFPLHLDLPLPPFSALSAAQPLSVLGDVDSILNNSHANENEEKVEAGKNGEDFEASANSYAQLSVKGEPADELPLTQPSEIAKVAKVSERTASIASTSQGEKSNSTKASSTEEPNSTCGVAASVSGLTNNNNTVTTTTSTGGHDYKCTICLKTFKRRVGLEQHQQTMHGCGESDDATINHLAAGRGSRIAAAAAAYEQISSTSAVTKTSPKRRCQPHQCPHCRKVIKGKGALVNHVKAHALRQGKHLEGQRGFQGSRQVVPQRSRHPVQVNHSTANLRQRSSPVKAFVRPTPLAILASISKSKGPLSCPHCSVVLANRHSLTDHIIRRHTTDRPHQCPLCPRAFVSSKELLIHNRIHTGERPYVCRDCDADFTTKSSLNKHYRTKHEKDIRTFKKGSGGRKIYIGGAEMKTHPVAKMSAGRFATSTATPFRATSSPSPFNALHGKRSFNLLTPSKNNNPRASTSVLAPPVVTALNDDDDVKPRNLARHQQQSHSISLTKTDDDDDNHQDDHEEEVIQSETTTFPCPECPKTFSRADYLEKHMLTHRCILMSAYKCRLCGQFFESMHEIVSHQKSYHSGGSGTRSPAVDSRQQQQQQRNFVSQQRAQNQNKIQIRTKSSSLVAQQQQQAYLCQNGASSSVSSSIPSPSNPNVHQCPICRRLFNRKGSLTNHIKSHGHQDQFSGGQELMRRPSQFQQLRKMVPTAPLRLQQIRCAHCEKTFRHKSTLKTHLLFRHNAGKANSSVVAAVKQEFSHFSGLATLFSRVGGQEFGGGGVNRPSMNASMASLAINQQLNSQFMNLNLGRGGQLDHCQSLPVSSSGGQRIFDNKNLQVYRRQSNFYHPYQQQQFQQNQGGQGQLEEENYEDKVEMDDKEDEYEDDEEEDYVFMLGGCNDGVHHGESHVSGGNQQRNQYPCNQCNRVFSHWHVLQAHLTNHQSAVAAH